MSIETSAKPVAAKAADTADSRSRKSTGQTGASPASGFMAILSAMDESGVDTAWLADQENMEKVPQSSADSAQPATDLIAFSYQDAALILPATPLDPALQGQIAVLGSPAGADGASVTQGSDIALEAGLTVAVPLVPATPLTPSPTVAAPAKLLVGDEGQEVGALQAQVKSSASDKTGAKTKALPVAEQGAGRAVPDSSRIQESRFMATLEAMRGLQGGSPAEPAPNASPLATLLGEKPTAERGRLQERTPEGGFGVQPITLGTTSYASPAVQDGGAVSPEMYVAQEVSYWISQDVQNAELRLDGLGLEAVDVSITMHGNEAHVAFRTDELQARTMLEGAAAHLKEALQGEGLVLSGVSVGTSGGRDTGDNERKQRHGARQSASVPVSLERPEAGRPRGGTAGRTLDLFV